MRRSGRMNISPFEPSRLLVFEGSPSALLVRIPSKSSLDNDITLGPQGGQTIERGHCLGSWVHALDGPE